jgi:hypothetical protein
LQLLIEVTYGQAAVDLTLKGETWSPVPSAISPFHPIAEGNGRFYRVIESSLSPAGP